MAVKTSPTRGRGRGGSAGPGPGRGRARVSEEVDAVASKVISKVRTRIVAGDSPEVEDGGEVCEVSSEVDGAAQKAIERMREQKKEKKAGKK